MRVGTRIVGVLSIAAAVLGCHREAVSPPTSSLPTEMPSPIDASRTQLVTIVSMGWDGFETTLRRYERTPGGEWRPAGTPIDTVIGRAGYGWGRGLHGDGAPPGRPGPIKQEGDGRSPAGVFEIGTAYGYDSTRNEVSLPYVQATRGLRCVDDPASRHYNRIVSTGEIAVDWKSAEHMRRDDDLYAIAILVEHNTRDTKPGAGSCIFVHVWRGPGIGMTGCTAMPMETLEAFAEWLRPGAAAWVALPESEYAALRTTWSLP